ncbi:TetR/AcrR family transcriptional regulator [Chryseobacterium gambrini]|uniref:Transcriptional regulator, TetR family n=1 Tax=Chryseobacterium gambrini TaxID=373672 RepID=A0A1N7MK53_9FLAO|nr:TetR/AcrR family transcriptional regulator [Chryseobacterium gambrini]SIS86457.1 transcriptional regulator, TetR family [Chryseobacterium gambrini]
MATKGEKTKQFILEIAAPLYNEKGISGVSIDDIVEASKLTKGCIYGHFQGKDDLSEQVIEYSLNHLSEKITAAVLKENTAKEKIGAFMDFYKNPINTFIDGGCPLFNTAVEADDNFPSIKQKVAARFAAGQEALSGILQEGIDSGELSSKLNPKRFAFKMVAAIEGGIVICRTIDSAKPMYDLVQDLKDELQNYSL